MQLDTCNWTTLCADVFQFLCVTWKARMCADDILVDVYTRASRHLRKILFVGVLNSTPFMQGELYSWMSELFEAMSCFNQ